MFRRTFAAAGGHTGPPLQPAVYTISRTHVKINPASITKAGFLFFSKLYFQFRIAQLQLGYLLPRLFHKLFVFIAVGIKRTMVQGVLHRFPLVQPSERSIAEACLLQTLPNVFNGLVRGVYHVFTIEPVVAKLVVDYFVGGEVI